MQEIKNIICEIFLLIADILAFTYHTIKQIIFPNRKRKGNFLSTLFIFFIGIIERLNLFEHSFFKMGNFFRKKYVKQPIFFIGSVLFLLSLFEWTGDQRFSYKAEIASTKQLPSNLSVEKKIIKPDPVNAFTYEKSLNKTHPEFYSPFNSSFTYSLLVKKFLLIRNLRI